MHILQSEMFQGLDLPDGESRGDLSIVAVFTKIGPTRVSLVKILVFPELDMGYKTKANRIISRDIGVGGAKICGEGGY